MRRLAGVVWPVVLVVALASSLAADEPGGRAADRELLQRVMTEERIEVGTPRPGPMLYLRDAAWAFNQALQRGLSRLAPGLSALAAPIAIFALELLGLGLVLMLALILVRLVRRRLAERPATRVSSPFAPLPADAAAATPVGERGDTLRRLLGEGRVDEAIEALWWWLASVLVPRGAEPSWTSRELVGRAGRGDLMPLVRRLDRMIYGAARPTVDEVRGLWRKLREGVA